MIKLKFTVPIKPFGKQRPYYSTTQRKVFTPEKTKTYEDIIRMAYISQCKKYRFPDDVPIEIYILAEFAIPKSISKKNKELMLSGKIRPTKVPDVDNVAKQILDSLQGICYKNDCNIVKLGISKIYSERDCLTIELRDANGENSP